ncbi:hypothetical protein GCM10023321_50730 [Pseudonocardia eucalypti]|uniref:Uncharacterized protein n=1 Tax=Pseudonocardia eucalypti TaxID=648755 RepID=A0ABP9QKT0_9PSEU
MVTAESVGSAVSPAGAEAVRSVCSVPAAIVRFGSAAVRFSETVRSVMSRSAVGCVGSVSVCAWKLASPLLGSGSVTGLPCTAGPPPAAPAILSSRALTNSAIGSRAE